MWKILGKMPDKGLNKSRCLQYLMMKEIDQLDREYNRHKEISAGLHELAKSIGQNALLISIGEEEGVREKLQKDRIAFEAGIRKLLQNPTDDLDLDSIGQNHL